MRPELSAAIAGGHDNAYISTLNSLNKEELLGKLAFLQGYNELSPEMLNLAMPTIHVPGLFLSEKPQILVKRSGPPAPLTIPSGVGTVTTTGGLISPQSETHSIGGSSQRSVTPGRPIDPTKVRWQSHGGCDLAHWVIIAVAQA